RVLLVQRQRTDHRIAIVALVRAGSIAPVAVEHRDRFLDTREVLVRPGGETLAQAIFGLHGGDEVDRTEADHAGVDGPYMPLAARILIRSPACHSRLAEVIGTVVTVIAVGKHAV